MKTFEELKKLVDDEIENISLPTQPANFYEPVKYILSLGGKRMRPILTLMACNIFSEDVKKALNAALGLEIFHNFTLLHDDIMDRSRLRRGKPTVNAKWNNNIAILSGDGMSFIASQFVVKVPSNVSENVLNTYFEMAVEICEGQQYDMDFEKADNVTIDQYINMIRLKTAVLPASCLKIGALIGGASLEQADKLYSVGINIGLAFQLQDDLLDVYGDVATLGKPIGGDICENKKTFMLLKAIELLSPTEGLGFKKYTSGDTIDRAEKIHHVTSMYNRLNIKEICQKEIDTYFQVAKDELKSLQLDNVDVLEKFIDSLYCRQK